MNRKEAFIEVASAARALADLAEHQKDTVGWWGDYGREFQLLNTAFLETKPVKGSHTRAAISEMERVQREKI